MSKDKLNTILLPSQRCFVIISIQNRVIFNLYAIPSKLINEVTNHVHQLNPRNT